MKNNTMKRVLAATLSVLTVAAYVPANVGGFLTGGSAIVANADDGAVALPDAQNDGILKIEADTVAFVEGVYEVTSDAGKAVYTKVEGNKIYTLDKDKSYAIRTTAYVAGSIETVDTPTLSDLRTKDLNNADLAEGVYEYSINAVGKSNNLEVTTIKSKVKKSGDLYGEQPVVTQNGKEIIYNETDGYVVAAGFPVEFVATPGETHTNQMLTVETGKDSDNNPVVTGIIKSQTKQDKTITLTFVPTRAAADGDVSVTWTQYMPTLKLTYDNAGTILATDVGFNKIVTDEAIGSYLFRYGNKISESKFENATVNDKGAYVAANNYKAWVDFGAVVTQIGKLDITYLNSEATTQYFKKNINGGFDLLVPKNKLDEDGKPVMDKDNNPVMVSPQEQTAEPGTYRAITTVTANPANATLSDGTFSITTEFTVANKAITSTNVHLWASKAAHDANANEIDPEGGIFKMPWANGDEVTPYIVFVDNNGKTLNAQVNGGTTANSNNEVSPIDYYITGTLTATEAGVYTMYLNPVSDAFTDKTPIEVTWQIVNANNYCEPKVDKSNGAATAAEAQNFTIGYRQANSKSLQAEIAKQLTFVGSDELKVVKYEKGQYVNGTHYYLVKNEERIDCGIKMPEEQGDTSKTWKYDNKIYEQSEGWALQTESIKVFEKTGEADDPSDTAGYYVAYVANALKNNDTTSAMVKDGKEVTDLVKVYFQVTKTKVQIVPAITEITYGEDVQLSSLYKVIDAATKEEIGVPWKKAPTLTLTSSNTVTSTKELNAGNYTYGVDGVLQDEVNYVLDNQVENNAAFTVKPRDISEITFGTVKVEATGSTNRVSISKTALADAAAKNIDANPSVIATTDMLISGGYTTAKVTDIGKVFTVNLKGVGNYNGTIAVSWIVGGNVLATNAASYEAEFDASKPRVMAKFDTTKIEGEIAECGFYYSNNDKGTGDPEALKQAGTSNNPKGSKVATFNEAAIAKAVKNNKGVLTLEIANSSVLKTVYVMPYVKFKNGEIAYGNVDKMNYYDMVMTAEGALDVTKTDFVGDGTTGTKGKTYVMIDVTRVNKQGYDVLRYGVVYNNSGSWDSYNEPDKANTNVNEADASKIEADKWLSLDHESEKTVKIAELDADDLNSKIGVNAYTINTTDATGVGAKHVYAKAFIQIKDGAGNVKTYYSNLADVTYGGYTINPATGENTTVVDSQNKTQVEFYTTKTYEEPDKSSTLDPKPMIAVDRAVRMAASTGDTTYEAWWNKQKNS